MKKVFGNIPTIPFVLFLLLAACLVVLSFQAGIIGKATAGLDLIEHAYGPENALTGQATLVFGSGDLLPETTSLEFLVLAHPCNYSYMCGDADKTAIQAQVFDASVGCKNIISTPWDACPSDEGDYGKSYNCATMGKKCCFYGIGNLYYNLNCPAGSGKKCWDDCALNLTLTLPQAMAFSAEAGKGNYTFGPYMNDTNQTPFNYTEGWGFSACSNSSNGITGHIILPWDDEIIPWEDKPDLIVKSLSLADNGNLYARIKNIGAASSSSCYLNITWSSEVECPSQPQPSPTTYAVNGNGYPGYQCLWTFEVQPLGIGQETIITAEGPVMFGGLYFVDKTVTATIDPDNSIAESNEGNNALARTLVACSTNGACRDTEGLHYSYCFDDTSINSYYCNAYGECIPYGIPEDCPEGQICQELFGGAQCVGTCEQANGICRSDCWPGETHMFELSGCPWKLPKCCVPTAPTCSGSIDFNLIPSTTAPNSGVKASVSISKVGSSTNCQGKIVNIKTNSCLGTTVCNRMLTEGIPAVNGEITYHAACSCNFNSPSALGTYTYYACVDMNNNGIYENSEYKTALLEVGVLSECEQADGRCYYISLGGRSCVDDNYPVESDLECPSGQVCCMSGIAPPDTCTGNGRYCSPYKGYCMEGYEEDKENTCYGTCCKPKQIITCDDWNNVYTIDLAELSSNIYAPEYEGSYYLAITLAFNDAPLSFSYDMFDVAFDVTTVAKENWIAVTDWMPVSCPATKIQTKIYKEVNRTGTVAEMPSGCQLTKTTVPFECVVTRTCEYLGPAGYEQITPWKPYPCDPAGNQWALFNMTNGTILNQSRDCCLENWTIDWQECDPETGLKEGVWIDTEECDTTYTKPAEAPESQICVPPAITWQKLMIWILITAIALVVIIAAALYAVKRAKTRAARVVKEAAKPAAAPAVAKSTAAAPAVLPKKEYPALRNYIKKARARGMTKEKIRQELLKSGWPADVIDKVLAA